MTSIQRTSDGFILDAGLLADAKGGCLRGRLPMTLQPCQWSKTQSKSLLRDRSRKSPGAACLRQC